MTAISSMRSWRRARTRRADSRLAMRRLMRRRSAGVRSGESGSPQYAIGRPTLRFSLGACPHPKRRQLSANDGASCQPANALHSPKHEDVTVQGTHRSETHQRHPRSPPHHSKHCHEVSTGLVQSSELQSQKGRGVHTLPLREDAFRGERRRPYSSAASLSQDCWSELRDCRLALLNCSSTVWSSAIVSTQPAPRWPLPSAPL